ncbi:MAG TPA: beta-propeller fold lactonase family protein [Candidatus Sulfotelmatobacter sp.]|jgi:6-phosphogluconolactonase (cycloisomerase 2 family)|nr:beta-propeller fold lactonase family protein [Candidatus Sulfotelmatobacter sp.]
MLKKAAALLLVGTVVGMCVSCGLIGSNSGSNRYVYAAIPASNEIVVYREDPNSGVLSQLAGSPISVGSAVQSLAIHPSKKFLYAANSGEGDISQFTILSGGGLQEMTPRPPAGTAPTVLVMDSAGSYLFVGNAGSNDISIFSIDSSSGLLTQVGTNVPIGLTPLAMKLSPLGNYLYVTGQQSQGFVEVFTVNAGAIAPLLPNAVFLTGNGPYGLEVASSGSVLYTANKIDNTISEFTVQSDGSLQQITGSPLGESFAGPAALLIDKSGTYMYVANQGSTNLAGYSVGSDGTIALLTTSPFGTGSQPSIIAADPNGKYLFVGNQSSPALQSFSLDGSTGTLTSVQTYPVPGNPTSIAVTP